MTILEQIGDTPLVHLPRLSRQTHANLYIKLETRNPGASIKDRPAHAMVQGALLHGTLTTGSVVLEATSGNMGIGLALVCGRMGIELKLAMPASASEERKTLLRALGAELHLTPAAEGMSGAVKKIKELLETCPGSLWLDQFSNPDGPRAHLEQTGPEILRQAAQQGFTPAAFVAGVGSGATITGVGQFLRGVLPQVHIAAVEPAESPVLSGGTSAPHGIQGIGAGFVPKVLNRAVLSEVVTVSVPQALETARRLLAEEGIIAGISTGANVHAALALASRPQFKDAHIVTIACDTGERYLSTPLFEPFRT